jgi:hypothetical protein
MTTVSNVPDIFALLPCRKWLAGCRWGLAHLMFLNTSVMGSKGREEVMSTSMAPTALLTMRFMEMACRYRESE